jgi:hypothetical protein
MSTRNPIAVAKKHMAKIEQWTVHKVLKPMQITLGTALYMVWSADDQKRSPPKVVVGNIRVGLLQAITGGVHIFLFKDHTVRKVHTTNLAKVVEVSNSIHSSGLTVHRNDKTLATKEPLGESSSGEGEDSDDEDGEEDESADDDSDGVASKKGQEAESTGSSAGHDERSKTSDGATTLGDAVENEGRAGRDAGVVTDYGASEKEGGGDTQHKSVEGNLTSTSDQNSPDVERVASLPLPAVGPLYNPPPPPTTAALQPHSNPPPSPTTTGGEQCSSTLPDTVRELRAMKPW